MGRPLRRIAQRADSRLGRIYNRVLGWFCIAVGLLVIITTAYGDGFALATHWPGLAFGILFLLLGRYCLRSRAGMLETLSETPVDRGGR